MCELADYLLNGYDLCSYFCLIALLLKILKND